MSATRLPDTHVPLTWPEHGLRPHRFASTFRMLGGEEKERLDASVLARGLLSPIVIFQNAILDGRNRYLALVDTGLFDPAQEDWRAFADWRRTPALFTEFTGTEAEALDRIWALNEERRHDSAGERAMAAARRKTFLDELAGADPAALRKTDAQLAAEHGVSERLLNSANSVVRQAAPEVQDAVDAGVMSVTDAAAVATLDHSEQRSIVETPDRKAVKQKVKAATAPKQAPLPELPSPVPRGDLAQFAETVIREAQRVAGKHGGPGASLSADFITGEAVKAGLIDRDGGFSRAMLLVLGKLRDAPEGPQPAKDEGLPDLPLGGEWRLGIGDLKPGHSASIAVFHEEDDSYSIGLSYDFPTRSASGPMYSAHASFRDAVIAAGALLAADLDVIAGSADSVTTDAERKSARAGLAWLERRFKSLGLPKPEAAQPDLLTHATPELEDLPAPDVPAEAYARLVEEQGERKGNHTRATAEPILRAGRAAGVDWQAIADAVGHPLGTVQGWSHKLGLTGQGTGRAAPRRRASEGAAA